LKSAALASAGKADAAIAAAGTPDPLEQRRRDYVTKILDWRDGTSGPIDIKSFPDQTGISLYNDAKAVTDAGRVGKGYGTLDDGSNPAYSAALDKELASDRALEASGRVENFVNNSIAGADAEAGNLSGIANARNMAIAGMRNSDANADQDRYVSWLTRPKPPSMLKRLALGGLSALNFSPFKSSQGGLNSGGLNSINDLSI
jgi:hypothetical protein